MIRGLRLAAPLLRIRLGRCFIFAKSAPIAPTDLGACTDAQDRSRYRPAEGDVVIDAPFDHAARFAPDGVAAVHQARSWRWIHTRGWRLLPTFIHHNGADHASEGLARFVRADGKIGHADATATVRLPARVDFATPLQDGFAVSWEGWARNGALGKTKSEGG